MTEIEPIGPRLYSRPSRIVVDVIAPRHETLHAELIQWGRWSQDRRHRLRCQSAEGQYLAPWRQWHYPTAAEMMPRLLNPRLLELDRAVLRLPDQHRTMIRLVYVEGRVPEAICRAVAIPRTAYVIWMHDARAMVVNLLRRADGR